MIARGPERGRYQGRVYGPDPERPWLGAGGSLFRIAAVPTQTTRQPSGLCAVRALDTTVAVRRGEGAEQRSLRTYVDLPDARLRQRGRRRVVRPDQRRRIPDLQHLREGGGREENIPRASGSRRDERAFCIETLLLLSKQQMVEAEKQINVLWKGHFVDRQVREAVSRSSGSLMPALVRMIVKRTQDFQLDRGPRTRLRRGRRDGASFRVTRWWTPARSDCRRRPPASSTRPNLLPCLSGPAELRI